jgi:hypothetical protein
MNINLNVWLLKSEVEFANSQINIQKLFISYNNIYICNAINY